MSSKPHHQYIEPDLSAGGVPKVYAVLGNPVAHSLSPVMLNRAFRETGYRGLYVALKVTDIAGAIAGVRALGFSGASVTVPHKVAVMDHLDEIDPTARAIGAVNTVVNQNGRLVGTNTDAEGAVAALKEKTRLKGRVLAVVGAGGAARAVAYGAVQEGAEIVIVNRSEARGRSLSRFIGCSFVPLVEFTGAGVDILVNTTPVGMSPRIDQLPVDAGMLKKEMVVMDVVYNPMKTRLLKEAEKRGCKTVDGAAMFVYQGARQFTLWTGVPAPVEVMREVVSDALGGFR
ncbi:MAG: shikimate dehydrogenase [Desulfobacterales bacterium]|nr:shikimate dehydrogenase [Desulfobacterales bacterium]